MLTYDVTANRIDGHVALVACKDTKITVDIDPAGRLDAFNPAELFLASIAACMLKGIERVTPMLHFELRGVAVHLTAQRQDAPPKILSVNYTVTVDTDETDQRLELLHTNVRKYGTIFNTVADAVALDGSIVRA